MFGCLVLILEKTRINLIQLQNIATLGSILMFAYECRLNKNGLFNEKRIAGF